MVNPVSRILSELGISHRVFRHPGKILSLAQAASERGQEPEQVVRTIVFRLSDGEFAIVLMAGPSQISWQKLRHHFGVSRISMASEEEVLAVTGYRPGAVSPIGILRPFRTLVDESVLVSEEVSIGSGIRGEAVILKSIDLLKAIGSYEIGIFKE